MNNKRLDVMLAAEEFRLFSVLCNDLGCSRAQLVRGLIRSTLKGYINVEEVTPVARGRLVGDRQRVLKLHPAQEERSSPAT